MSFYRTIAADAVFSLTMLLRAASLAAVLAALSATPASAQVAPTLDPLKPCYVAAREDQVEYVTVSGGGFTPFAFMDILIDGTVPTDVAGADPQADGNGKLAGSVTAPFPNEDERPFTLRVAERDHPDISVSQVSKVTRLAVTQRPAVAATSDRVTFSGRGFTTLGAPVYMHYVFNLKSRKTIRVGPPTGDCGLFSVKRKQFPFKKSPQVGVWTIQFDQQRRYDPKASPRVPLTVKVRKAPKVKPTRAPAR